jgi:hypothetical protein
MAATAQAVVNLDQCQNGTLANLAEVCGSATPPPSWDNGNVNQSNSQYREGDGLPYRNAITGLQDGTYSVMVDYDFTQGGKFALDRLTRFNLTQASDPCLNTGLVACTVAATEFTFTMPGDINPILVSPPNFPDLPNTGGLDIAGTASTVVAADRLMTIWVDPGTAIGTFLSAGSNCVVGDQANSLNDTFVLQSGPATGNSNRQFGFKFSLSGCPVVGGCNVMMGWTGHIASSETAANGGWTAGFGASFITGAPFHMRIVGVDNECGTSGGNQDRSVQLSALVIVPEPTILTVIKRVVGDPAVLASDFTMTITSNLIFQNPGNVFPGDEVGVEKIVTGNFGAYTVTESDVPNCTADPPGGEGDCNSTIAEGESLTCIFTNICVTTTTTTTTLAPVQPVDIPTLSEWGRIGMALLLAAVAIWYLRRRSVLRT